MIASDTSNIGAILVALAIVAGSLTIAVVAAIWSAVRVATSSATDFVVGTKAGWMATVLLSPAVGAVVWYRLVEYANYSLTYSNDDPFFWVIAGAVSVAAGVVGPLTWYRLDGRHRIG